MIQLTRERWQAKISLWRERRYFILLFLSLLTCTHSRTYIYSHTFSFIFRLSLSLSLSLSPLQRHMIERNFRSQDSRRVFMRLKNIEKALKRVLSWLKTNDNTKHILSWNEPLSEDDPRDHKDKEECVQKRTRATKEKKKKNIVMIEGGDYLCVRVCTTHFSFLFSLFLYRVFFTFIVQTSSSKCHW